MSDHSEPSTINPPRGNTTYTRLGNEALLEVTGRDAISFLHNQASCDIKQIATGQAVYGTFCNPQGRVLADFVVQCLRPEHCRLRLRRDILQSTLDTLGRFALFSKVALAAATENLVLLAIQGPGAREKLEPLFGQLPDTALGYTGDASASVLQMDSSGEAFELWVDTAARQDIPQALQGSISATGSEAEWEAAGLARGIARITAATSGELLPQQLNYDLTGHINFRKGCYPGQEVIARMHYKGKAKRRLLLMQLPEGTSCGAGDGLYLPGRESSAGQVVNVATSGDGSTLALVTTTRNALSDGLCLAPDQGAHLIPLELPYPVPFD